MKYMNVAVAAAVLCAAACSAAEFRFVVVDEDTGERAAGVDVGAIVWCNGVDRGLNYDRTTDVDGSCAINKRNARSVRVFTERDAERYKSSVYKALDANHGDAMTITVGVRRVVKPIPLIVKAETPTHMDLFGQGHDVLQYDFFKGSYLPPVGTGVVADVEFRRMPEEDLGLTTRTGREIDEHEMRKRLTMTVRFPGADNGVVKGGHSQCSSLKLRTAPADGYVQSYQCTDEDGLRMERITSWEDGETLCFRIRTRRNQNGEIVESYYGKIYGDIGFVNANRIRMGSPLFTYYLNPASMDVNLEYDQRHNICPGASYSEFKP